MSNFPELAEIANSPIMIKRTPDGTMQAIKGIVSLSIQNKELVEIKKSISITASGYDKLNQIAGLSLIMPRHIEVPKYGKQPNPFVLINEETSSIKFVMAKMSGVGYSPIGNLCVVDQTLLFSLDAYFKMDCMAKVKWSKNLGRIANKKMLTEDELKTGLFLPIINEDFGIWLDAKHEDFMKLMSEAQQRQRFAERIALGIIKRNCLRHHPAIAASIVQPENGVANVTVIGYRHEMTENQMRNIVEGERDSTVETISEVLHTDDMAEDMATTTKESGVGEQNTEVDDGEYQPSKRDKLLARADELITGTLDKDEYEEFLKISFKVNYNPQELKDEELEKFVRALGEYTKAVGK